MFTLRKISCPYVNDPQKSRTVSGCISHNNNFIFGTNDGHVIKWNSETGDTQDFDISRDAVHELFLDNSGHHLVVSVSNGDLHYLHSRSLKAKKLSKVGGVVESLAFDRLHSTENHTKSFLVGTSTGRIYEFNVDSGGREKTFQQIYQLESSIPITSIYFENFSIDNSRDSKTAILFATTSPTRLYHFFGSGAFQNILVKDIDHCPYVEFPGILSRSQIRCFSKKSSTKSVIFALLTSIGIFTGPINMESQFIFSESQMLHFQSILRESMESILSFVITDYHFILLTSARLQVMSRLTGDVVQNEDIKGEPVSLFRDSYTNTPWLVFTNFAVFQIFSEYEDRDVWKLHLQKAVAGDERQFDNALALCRKENRGLVYKAQADFYMKRKLLGKAAQIYAHSELSFDEVVLLLLNSFDNTEKLEAGVYETICCEIRSNISRKECNKHGACLNKDSRYRDMKLSLVPFAVSSSPKLKAVRLYLEEVLSKLPMPAKSQRSMLCTWLSEIYIHQISALSLSSQSASLTSHLAMTLALVNPTAHKIVLSTRDLDCNADEQEFKQFLRLNKSFLDHATTINLLLSRDQVTLLRFYAQIVGDYDQVVFICMKEKKYSEALSVLSAAPFERVEGLIYKVAPLLVENEPEITVDFLLSCPRLNLADILPAFYRYCVKLDESTAARPYSVEDSAHIDTQNYAIIFIERSLANMEQSGSTQLRASSFDALHKIGAPKDKSCDNSPPSYSDNSNKRVSSYGVSETERRQTLWHTLLFLLSKYDDTEESKLLSLLTPLLQTVSKPEIFDSDDYCILAMVSEAFNNDPFSETTQLPFDIDYAIKLFRRFGRSRAAALMYSMIGLNEFAIELAVGVDLNLAFSIASQSIDETNKKKLWVKIVKCISIANKDISGESIMRILQESHGMLRIEDILPYLPDFSVIDLFKDDICNTLESFGSKIESLKSEMEELADSAETIVKDLDLIKKRGYGFNANQRCEYCSDAIFSKQFYLFPCGHGFHSDCILSTLSDHVEQSQVEIVRDIDEKLRSAKSRVKDSDRRAMMQMEYLQCELDGYIAAECSLCGDFIINLVATSLISESDVRNESRLWAL